ncbi:MAG: hypothetical protein WDM89_05690 [Rhizomicrobium sp.]
MVLTDILDKSYEVYGAQFLHDGPLAYVRGIPSETGMDYRVQWYRPAADGIENAYNFETAPDSLAPPVKPLCTPENFSKGLSGNSRKLWAEILQPGLLKLDAKFTKPSHMGFEVQFRLRNYLFSLLLVGWPERDDRNVSREEETFGSASMRVDVHVKRLYEACGRNVQLTNKWMNRFYDRGWRGRPSNKMLERWGVSWVSAEELESKVQGIMRYLPRSGISCHNGRFGDADSLRGLLVDVEEFLKE